MATKMDRQWAKRILDATAQAAVDTQALIWEVERLESECARLEAEVAALKAEKGTKDEV